MTEFHFTLGDRADGINGDHQAEINVTGEITATIGCLAADEVQAKALRGIVICRLIGYPLEQKYVAKLEDEVRGLTEKLEKAQMEIEALSTENGFVHQHAEEDKKELRGQLEAERKRLDWALDNSATFYDWQGKNYLSYDTENPEDGTGFDVLETDNPRATIDELIAGEKK